MNRRFITLLIAAICFAPTVVRALETEFVTVIRDHRFEPEIIHIPADTKVKLIVDNQDNTPEEFESHSMKREKVIPGQTKASIWIGPLKKGDYSFVGEFHEATAKGKIIAE